MKVLVLSPEKKDTKSRERRRLVVAALEDFKVKLLNPYPGRPPKKKFFKALLFPEFFYNKEDRLLDKADFIIADLTKTDFKTGFLISRALVKNKPILALFWEDISEKKFTADWNNESLFFTECFNKENTRSVLRHFLEFVRLRRRRRGKLIVIDGTDGSGKATQVKLLVAYLKKNSYRVKHIDFPRYYSSFHGGMVGRYLKGEFGGLAEVNPYLASLIYALDRLTAKQELDDWLRAGNIIVANRYTSSNMAHQTARVKKNQRENFLRWLMEMEYKVHKLPREDLVIFLHVPVEIGQKLVDKKKKRKYLGKKGRDIQEASLKHLKEAGGMYLSLAKKFKHWVKIECVNKKGKILSRRKIHQKILDVLRRRKII